MLLSLLWPAEILYECPVTCPEQVVRASSLNVCFSRLPLMPLSRGREAQPRRYHRGQVRLPIQPPLTQKKRALSSLLGSEVLQSPVPLVLSPWLRGEQVEKAGMLLHCFLHGLRHRGWERGAVARLSLGVGRVPAPDLASSDTPLQ